MKFIFKISKSFSSDLKSKHKDGKWITSNGSHLFITGQGENRKVIAGLGGFNGLIDEYFKEQSETREAAKSEPKSGKDSKFGASDKDREGKSKKIEVTKKSKFDPKQDYKNGDFKDEKAKTLLDHTIKIMDLSDKESNQLAFNALKNGGTELDVLKESEKLANKKIAKDKNNKDKETKKEQEKPKQEPKQFESAKKTPEEVKEVTQKENDVPSTESKKRFSAVKEIPRTEITTDAHTFQGRQKEYSEESVNKIVSEGFDKTNDPIVVWHDEEKDKYVVISGHSRWEASKRLYAAGDKSLAEMPVKEFMGNKTDAANYAILESNRASTNEGFISDVKAVNKMMNEGYNSKEMSKYIKPKSYLDRVVNYTYLNPEGKFLEMMAGDSKVSFPYLDRNAEWVGTLKKMYFDKETKKSKISPAQENEIFNYIYQSDKKGLSLKKDEFFNLIQKKVNNNAFSSDKSLNLKDVVSSNPITAQGNAIIKQHENDIETFKAEISRKQDLSVAAMIKGDMKLSDKFEEDVKNLNKKVIDSKIKLHKLKASMEKVENQVSTDLFSKGFRFVFKMDFFKSLSHKYKSKKADGKGGYIYDYGNVQLGNGGQKQLMFPENNIKKEPVNEIVKEKEIQLHEEIKQPVTKPVESTTKEFNTSLEGLRRLAYDAHRGTSFVPEKRAESFVKDYSETLANDVEILKKRGEDVEGINKYIDVFKSKLSSYLSSRGRCLSTMITGASNFNVRRNEKAFNAERNKYKEFSEWRDKVLNRKQKSSEKITPDSELGKAQIDLDSAKKLQKIMVESNKIIRSKKDVTNRLIQLGLSEKIANELQKPDFANRLGFPQFETTNNNAKIKRLEGRVKELSNKIEKREEGKEEKYSFDGGNVEINRNEDRIQILFPGKPERSMIDNLKSNGYHWSPTNSAWQRKITNNSLYGIKFLNLSNLKKQESLEPKELPSIDNDFEIKEPEEVKKSIKFTINKSIIPHKQLYSQQIAEKQNIDHEKLENGYMDKINNLFGNMGLNVSNGRQVSHLSSNEIDILNKFKKALKETKNLKQAVKLSGMNTTIFEKIKSLM